MPKNVMERLAVLAVLYRMNYLKKKTITKMLENWDMHNASVEEAILHVKERLSVCNN